MAWIRTIDEAEAEGPLREAYEKIGGARGRVANVFKVESLDPEAIRAHLDFYMSLLYGKSGLSRFQREMIALTVSSRNACNYCATHHGEAFGKYAKDPNLVAAIRSRDLSAPIDSKDRAMLDYAVKLTEAPATVNAADIEKLRAVGFSDADVLRINMIASYFNFVNRLVLGLGVELERDEERLYKH